MTLPLASSKPSTRSEATIVIVGGGIAGATLATVLSRAGRQVLVLESTEVFRDRVRGESMMPWGVAEAQALGVADLLYAAGAHTSAIWKRYTEGDGTPRDLPVGYLLPGVRGTLNLQHPVACQALLDAAAKDGAVVQRGVRDVVVLPGTIPRVSYWLGGRTFQVDASLVVGADGRGSAVRRSAGITLEEQEATTWVAGMLLEQVSGGQAHDVVLEHDLGMCLLVHQGGGRARAYHIVPWSIARAMSATGVPSAFWPTPHSPARPWQRPSPTPVPPVPAPACPAPTRGRTSLMPRASC
jgi:2-polyprenyl-6-methoxyphenol hydroxylase-like FAD-dependent oxidoreductase